MSGELYCLAAGNTLVLQPAGTDQPSLRAFAAGLATDAEHTVVVLGADYPPAMWGPVLPALAERDGPVRLVPGTPAITSTVPIGQWLASQTGRTVLAQDGPALAAARGAMFVPPGAGTGWVRLRPGEPPELGSRRFPAPWWAGHVVEDITELSSASQAEPLPGGAWLRPWSSGGHHAEPEPGLNEHRQLLIAWLAWRHDRIYVPLGYPGSAPVALADIGRFWEQLPPAAQSLVRFVPYGPVALPGGTSLGEALAGLLGAPARVCTGLPWSERTASGVIHTRSLHENGSPGWPPFATELTYSPKGTDGACAGAVSDHRPPVPGLAETAPGIYAYERGTVIEVVASGLWLRSAAADGPSVARTRQLAPAEPVVFVDTSAPDSCQLPELTRKLVDSLEPEIGNSCRVLPADAEAAEDLDEPEPEAVAEPDQVAEPEPVAQQRPEPVAEPESPAEPGPEPVAEPETEPEPEPVPVLEAGPPAIRLESGPGTAAVDPGPLGPLLTVSFPPEPAAPAEAEAPAAGTPLPDLAPAGPPPQFGTVTDAGSVDSGRGDIGQPLVTPGPPTAAGASPVRAQQVPPPEACAVPPARGLAQERTWLRRTLSRQYDATASLAGRMLAENPGLRADTSVPPAELLTDLVALHLYLNGHGPQLDEAVRGAKVGPHVPFSRCVAAGLRRLPSYRGATRLRATLADAEWRWYDQRHVVTEWAFCSALADGRSDLPGSVEFRIWSMTGRRTSLVDPRLPAQVLFLPGTNFKVLQVSDDGPREVLLRELSASEIGADGRIELSRVRLDEIALAGLEQARNAWPEADAVAELPSGYQHRFGNPPGLIVKAGAGASGRTAQAAS